MEDIELRIKQLEKTLFEKGLSSAVSTSKTSAL